MPSSPFEVFWVHPCKVVTDVGYRMVIRQLNLNADDERQLLVLVVVGSPVGNVRCGTGISQGILIATAVCTRTTDVAGVRFARLMVHPVVSLCRLIPLSFLPLAAIDGIPLFILPDLVSETSVPVVWV